MEDSDGNKEMRKKNHQRVRSQERRRLQEESNGSRGQKLWVGLIREDREVAIGSANMGHF